MLRSLRTILCACLLASGMLGARAFSLLGPYETWQSAGLGFRLLSDIGGPHNIGEEFRWVTPTITYAYDSAFLNYYGTNGVQAIDRAFAIMNRLPAFSTMTIDDLNSYPQGDSFRVNASAAALRLLDLKSIALSAILEELGLAEPERWTFCLHQRFTTATTTNYTVVQRNFDPVTFSPSKYVNGIRYSYSIFEFALPTAYADALETVVDTSRPVPFSSIAGRNGGFGQYAVNLSRDDVGGLRYIYNRFNKNVEGGGASDGSVVVLTNFNATQILTTFDLSQFSIQSLVSDAATLTALYPGLIITNTVQSLTSAVLVASVYVTNINAPGVPASALLSQVLATNFVNGFINVYHHSYANVVTNLYRTNTTFQLIDYSIGRPPGAPASSPFLLRAQTTSVTTNIPSGNIIINSGLNFTNLAGFSFVDPNGNSFPVLSNIVSVTNLVFAGSNTFNGETFARQSVFTVTNLVMAGFPVVTNALGQGLRGGADKLTFVRVHYDEANPQTYLFTNNSVIFTYTNDVVTTQLVQRVQTAPDFLISAGDLGTPTDGVVPFTFSRTAAAAPNWIDNAAINQGNVGSGVALAGPGEIRTPVVLTFTKIGPAYLNFYPFDSARSEEQAFRSFFFGSFDGTTNAPVLYPKELTLKDLESKLFPSR